MPVLDRRTLLRGLGAAVALPLLDAMIPTRARADATSPKRLVTWFLPNGRVKPRWVPSRVGPTYDLPIAVGIMVAGGQILADVSDAVFLGELSLDGAVRHAQGILPIRATSTA